MAVGGSHWDMVGMAGNVPELPSHLWEVESAVYLQAPALSTVKTLEATNRTRRIGKLVKPVCRGGQVPCGRAFASHLLN